MMVAVVVKALACAASKIAQQAAITGSWISMVVLRTTPQRRPAMAKVEHTSFALNKAFR